MVSRPHSSLQSFFHLLVAIKSRLAINGRMTKWSSLPNLLCKFCGLAMDTRSHLSFECSATRSMESAVLSRLQIRMWVGNWYQELQWVTGFRISKSTLSTTVKLAFTCFTHVIWREDSARIFQNNFESLHILQASILDLLKDGFRSVPRLDTMLVKFPYLKCCQKGSMQILGPPTAHFVYNY